MSEIKVNSIKGVGASAAAITVNNTDGTCTANITNKPNRNLIINGAVTVQQRMTASTSGGQNLTGVKTVDRFGLYFSGTDNSPTQIPVDVAAGTTPYTLGFRRAFKIINGNQTSGAGADDYIYFGYKIEAQDIANSGWNYTSTSSYITLSFWIKSSVAQNFNGHLTSQDGTAQNYPFQTGSLSADTWTKVTKTISGNSNLTFNNDNGFGLFIVIAAFNGTNRTGTVTNDAWAAYASGSTTNDDTSTWYTTDDATLEITGLQLEVGSVATDFEHRSFDEMLQLCFRYCQAYDAVDGQYTRFAFASASDSSNLRIIFPLQREMRAKPSAAFTGSFECPGAGGFNINNVIVESNTGSRKTICLQQGSLSITAYQAYQFNASSTSALITFTSEL